MFPTKDNSDETVLSVATIPLPSYRLVIRSLALDARVVRTNACFVVTSPSTKVTGSRLPPHYTHDSLARPSRSTSWQHLAVPQVQNNPFSLRARRSLHADLPTRRTRWRYLCAVPPRNWHERNISLFFRSNRYTNEPLLSLSLSSTTMKRTLRSSESKREKTSTNVSQNNVTFRGANKFVVSMWPPPVPHWSLHSAVC